MGHALIRGETPTESQSGDRARTRRRRHQLAGQEPVARVVVGNQIDAGLVQVLLESFKVAEDESLVLLDGPAQRHAILIPLEAGNGTGIEEIASVQVAVAQEFIHRSVEIVAAGLRHDQNLRARAFSVLGAVGIAQHVELAHGIHAQQFPTGAAGLHVVLGRAGEFDAIQQEKILLRPVAFDREIVPVGGVRYSDAADFLPGEIHHAGIQRDQ